MIQKFKLENIRNIDARRMVKQHITDSNIKRRERERERETERERERQRERERERESNKVKTVS